MFWFCLFHCLWRWNSMKMEVHFDIALHFITCIYLYIHINVLIPFLIVFEFDESQFLVNEMHSNQIQFALNHYHCLLCLLVFQISFLCNSIQFNPFIWNLFALQIYDSWFWQPWTFSKLQNGSLHCISRRIGDFGNFFPYTCAKAITQMQLIIRFYLKCSVSHLLKVFYEKRKKRQRIKWPVLY